MTYQQIENQFSLKSFLPLTLLVVVIIAGLFLFIGSASAGVIYQTLVTSTPSCLSYGSICDETCNNFPPSGNFTNTFGPGYGTPVAWSDLSDRYIAQAWRGGAVSYDDAAVIGADIYSNGSYWANWREGYYPCTCGSGCAGQTSNMAAATFFNGNPNNQNTTIQLIVSGYQRNNRSPNAIAATADFGMFQAVCDIGDKAENGACVPITGSITVSPATCVAPCSATVTWNTNSYQTADILKNTSNLWLGAAVSSTQTDSNLTTGASATTYTYCVRGHGGGGVQTADLACASIVVNPLSGGGGGGGATGTISASPNPIATCSATGVTTITVTSSVNYDVRVSSANGALFMSGGPGTASSTTGNWVINGMVFYLQKSGDITSAGTLATTAVPLSCGGIILTIVKAGTGSGIVTTSPAVINCGATCSASYISGIIVSLLTSADAGSNFAGWTGDADCTDGTVTMNASKSCTATFNLQAATDTTVNISPFPVNGYVIGHLWLFEADIYGNLVPSIDRGEVINCGSGSRARCSFTDGTTHWSGDGYIFQAFPDPNYALTVWTGPYGPCRDTPPKCTILTIPGASYTLGVKFVAPTLSVTPNTGTVPLNNVSLTASFDYWNNAPYGVNSVIYSFDCNNDGINDASSGLLYGAGMASYTASNICNYPTVGTYTAKVTAQWDGFYPISKATAYGFATVTVNAAASIPTITISANPNPISYNTSTTVTWSSTGATSCTVSPGAGTGTSGTLTTGNLTTNTTYTATCTGPGGTSSGSVTVTPPLTISVSLIATPSSNPAPLTSVLSASVGGATGTINYSFWWNCPSSSYSGTSVAAAIIACGNPDGVTGNATGNKFDAVVATSQNTVPHIYATAGTYTPLVIVERGPNARATTTVTVSAPLNAPPIVSAVTVTEPNYCGSGPDGDVSWTYSDAESDPQTFYQVQVDLNSGSFVSPVYDSTQVPSPGNTAVIPQGILLFNTAYKARVRVWEAGSIVPTSWVNQSLCSGPGCAINQLSWTTPVNAYPAAQFTWSPTSPPAKSNVNFTDQSIFYDGTIVHTYSWDFGDGITSTAQNPVHQYLVQAAYTILENVSDIHGYTCPISKSITVKKSIPSIIEVAPK